MARCIVEGLSVIDEPETAELKERGKCFGTSCIAAVMVKNCTDGHRLLVVFNCGNAKTEGVYAYELNFRGMPQPSSVVRV